MASRKKAKPAARARKSKAAVEEVEVEPMADDTERDYYGPVDGGFDEITKEDSEPETDEDSDTEDSDASDDPVVDTKPPARPLADIMDEYRAACELLEALEGEQFSAERLKSAALREIADDYGTGDYEWKGNRVSITCRTDKAKRIDPVTGKVYVAYFFKRQGSTSIKTLG